MVECGDICTADLPTARAALRQTHSSISPCDRLRFWLTCLGIFPTFPVPRYPLSELVRAYATLRSTLPRLPESDARLVHLDTVRSEGWFRGLAAQAQIDVSGIDPLATALRIFEFLHAHGGLPYFQGCDRFAWVCLIVALQCTADISSLEAIASFLTEATVRASNLHGFLADTTGLLSRFAEVDREVEALSPEVSGGLARFGHTAADYAVRWAIMWFADEHPLDGILEVWDNIISRFDRVQDLEYLWSLTLAHVVEVRVPVDGRSMLAVIQNNTEWPMARIIPRADGFWREGRFAKKKRRGDGRVWPLWTSPMWIYGAIAIIILLILWFMMR
jgi:hypothetical protein